LERDAARSQIVENNNLLAHSKYGQECMQKLRTRLFL
jgi:hypothetical protein